MSSVPSRLFSSSEYLYFPPDINRRVPLTLLRFFYNVLPVYLLYYLTAVLVQRPGTRLLRAAIAPLTLTLAYVAGTAFNVSGGNPRYAYLSLGQTLVMWLIAMQVVDWTFLSTPPERVSPPASSVWWGAIDLMFNVRYLGWRKDNVSASRPQGRPMTSRSFALQTFGYFLVALTIYDVSHHSVQLLGPESFGTPIGGTIFDPSLPPLYRYIRSSFIVLLCGLVFWGSIDALQALASLIGVLLLGMSPMQWPPMSHEPWKATSLADFWGKRWHQTFRRTFLVVGGRPFSWIFGPKLGLPLGAFAISGLMHDWCSWSMGRGTDWRVQVFFVAMGLGCILERALEQVSGRKVSGWAGRVWTTVAVVAGGHLMVEPYLQMGLGGSQILPENLRVGKMLVEGVRRTTGWS